MYRLSILVCVTRVLSLNTILDDVTAREKSYLNTTASIQFSELLRASIVLEGRLLRNQTA